MWPTCRPATMPVPPARTSRRGLALRRPDDYEKAWQKLVEANPLPATHGRACYHSCESACNRTFLDAPVAIHAIERFLGDLAVENGWRIAVAPPSGKSALVVGADPPAFPAPIISRAPDAGLRSATRRKSPAA